MTLSSAASMLVSPLLGLRLGGLDPATPNHCVLEGVSWSPGQEGQTVLRIERLEATGLELSLGPFAFDVARLVLKQLAARITVVAGAPVCSMIEAAEAEVAGAQLRGVLDLGSELQGVLQAVQAPAAAAAAAPASGEAPVLSLAPLAGTEGTIRGKITDAQLFFDADVTVPIRYGTIELDDATVEHIGPDSRMGVSKMGIYLDAPNGRSYLYQFAAPPVAGVEYERRGALLGPWVSDRGKLHLQPFVESLLQQSRGGLAQGLTEQTRLLLGRTALAGDVQMGDGLLAVPGLQLRMEGRAEGRNAMRLHSDSVGSGLAADIAGLRVRDVVLERSGTRLACDSVAAALRLEIFSGETPMRFSLGLDEGRFAKLRLEFAGDPDSG